MDTFDAPYTFVLRDGNSLNIEPSLISQTPVIDRNPNVQLCKSHFKAQVGEPLDVLCEIIKEATADEVALEAVPVQGFALVKERLSESEVSVGFVVDGFNVVVVNVEFDIGGCGVGVVELGDVSGAQQSSGEGKNGKKLSQDTELRVIERGPVDSIRAELSLTAIPTNSSPRRL